MKTEKIKDPTLKTEKIYWQEGRLVCGVDEVGRGCIAGPVVAAAVVLPKGHKKIKNVRDSKKLTAKMRERIFEEILNSGADFGVGLVPAVIIDEIGIEKATKQAMAEALGALTFGHEVVLLDGNKELELSIEQKAIVKGDATVYSISCASIVAKVFRDAVVSGLHAEFPEYDFASHKGYGTKKHYEALKTQGPSREHRKTFLKRFYN